MKLILFFVLNFGALFIGSLFMPNPATDVWYQALHKAPWTPPGWVFGLAWFTVMFCFSFFMYYASSNMRLSLNNAFILLYSVQLLLNVSWNIVFFRLHMPTLAFDIIVLLLFIVIILMLFSPKELGIKKLLIAPYFIWLLIAISLNYYVVLKN